MPVWKAKILTKGPMDAAGRVELTFDVYKDASKIFPNQSSFLEGDKITQIILNKLQRLKDKDDAQAAVSPNQEIILQ